MQDFIFGINRLLRVLYTSCIPLQFLIIIDLVNTIDTNHVNTERAFGCRSWYSSPVSVPGCCGSIDEPTMVPIGVGISNLLLLIGASDIALKP